MYLHPYQYLPVSHSCLPSSSGTSKLAFSPTLNSISRNMSRLVFFIGISSSNNFQWRQVDQLNSFYTYPNFWFSKNILEHYNVNYFCKTSYISFPCSLSNIMHLDLTLDMHVKQCGFKYIMQKNPLLVSLIQSNSISTSFCCFPQYTVPSLIVEQKKKLTFDSYENNTLLSANAEQNSDNNKASCSHIIYHCLSHIRNHPRNFSTYTCRICNQISKYRSNWRKMFPLSCHYRSNSHFQIFVEISPTELDKIVRFINFKGTTLKLSLVFVHILHAR